MRGGGGGVSGGESEGKIKDECQWMSRAHASRQLPSSTCAFAPRLSGTERHLRAYWPSTTYRGMSMTSIRELPRYHYGASARFHGLEKRCIALYVPKYAVMRNLLHIRSCFLMSIRSKLSLPPTDKYQLASMAYALGIR